MGITATRTSAGTDDVRGVDDRVAPWVRLGLIATAVPQVLIGLWAVLWPHSWFDSFPGIDPRLIAAEPPFNHHLVTDVGAGFLATGIALIAGAVLARRSGIQIALVAYLAFTVPHVLYHATNPAPALSGADQVLNVVLLSGGAILAGALLIGARPSTRHDRRAGERTPSSSPLPLGSRPHGGSPS